MSRHGDRFGPHVTDLLLFSLPNIDFLNKLFFWEIFKIAKDEYYSLLCSFLEQKKKNKARHNSHMETYEPAGGNIHVRCTFQFPPNGHVPTEPSFSMFLGRPYFYGVYF